MDNFNIFKNSVFIINSLSLNGIFYVDKLFFLFHFSPYRRHNNSTKIAKDILEKKKKLQETFPQDLFPLTGLHHHLRGFRSCLIYNLMCINLFFPPKLGLKITVFPCYSRILNLRKVKTSNTKTACTHEWKLSISFNIMNINWLPVILSLWANIYNLYEW